MNLASLGGAGARRLQVLARAARGSEYDRFRVHAWLAGWLYPPATLTDFGRIWTSDEEYQRERRRFDGEYPHNADRRFMLRSLLTLADDVPGDTAECGVYRGAASWFICRHFAGSGRTHFAFDSFEGLSDPDAADGAYWAHGDLAMSALDVAEVLRDFDAKLMKGWIPERFPEVADRTFAFVHIDVDLYQPTRDSLAFFYPRMNPGAVILCDDYGFSTCPGAKQAFDEFLLDKPEGLVHVPTGQAFIIKK